MNGLRASVFVALTLLVTACSSISAQPSAAAPVATRPPTIPAGIDPFAPQVADLVRVDQQGAVAVQVTPGNLQEDLETLEFEVSLNTHSVDLSMDLAALSTLSTDTGLSIPATDWDAPRGGHHVQGTLRFASNLNAAPLLADAKRLTLTIRDLDVPARTFEWDLK